MAAAARAWISIATALVFVAPVRAQDGQSHSRLIPLPHPEILHPNDPNLPPNVLHPHVYRAPPHHLPRHQHLIPLPHPELAHPRPQASFETFESSGSGFIMTGTRQVDADEQPLAAIPTEDNDAVGSPREIPARIGACWHPPPLGGDPVHQVTVRMEFARDGSIIGKPLVTYVAAGSGARLAMTDSIQAALRQCTPLHFSQRLGADMAGYPIIIRFIQAHDDTKNPQH